MATESFELKFVNGKDLNQSWLYKINEKLRMVCEKVKCHIDLEEEEFEFVKWLFKAYWKGEYVILAQRLKLTDEIVIEQGLFADKTSENTIGTVLDQEPLNKNEKDNGENKEV